MKAEKGGASPFIQWGVSNKKLLKMPAPRKARHEKKENQKVVRRVGARHQKGIVHPSLIGKRQRIVTGSKGAGKKMCPKVFQQSRVLGETMVEEK